jgi:Calcineurin-like phosphoesterase
MHEAAGNQRFITESINQIKKQLANQTQELSDALGCGIGSADAKEIEAARVRLQSQMDETHQLAQTETDHGDKHYVSRFNPVGIFQSALSKIFSAVPDLQGYGDWNPLWVITEIEVFAYKVVGFLNRVYEDRTGKKQPVWAAIICELIHLKTVDDRAPYPKGIPGPAVLPDSCVMALLADWGGDNDAAHTIASIVRKQKPDISIHLGDIYYGGTEYECGLFLGMWPMRENWDDPKSALRARGSYALNGNHEMYSGGEYYFNTVLPAFNQAQPFFCIENDYWRIIGLDTAYAGGRLKPQSANDPVTAQWNWLVALLQSKKKATILLTHHEPVSAHHGEYEDSAQLRQDVADLLNLEGIGEDAVFGWFFGHEHRCALYKDTALKYNARLIGNGCIPHQVQREKVADPGCTEVDFFNKKETAPGTNTAVSSFAKLTFMGPRLLIEYVDEHYWTWGAEVWDSSKARLDQDANDVFHEYDDADGMSLAAAAGPHTPPM